MNLTHDDVFRLATLSRLELPQEAVERMTDEITSILGYVDRLQAVDVDGVEPFTMTAIADGFRPDTAIPADDVAREILLANFPQRQGDLLAAPGVFEAPKR